MKPRKHELQEVTYSLNLWPNPEFRRVAYFLMIPIRSEASALIQTVEHIH